MVVLPGPAFLVIPLGVAVLASEFAWARRVWRRGRILISRVRAKPIARERSKGRDQAALAPGAPLI